MQQSSLSFFFCWWTFRLLSCLGFCEMYANKHWGAFVLLNHVYIYICPRAGLTDHTVALFLVSKELPYCFPQSLYRFTFPKVFPLLHTLSSICGSGFFFFFFFLMMDILTSIRWYLIVLICICLIICDTEHLFHMPFGHLYAFLGKTSL